MIELVINKYFREYNSKDYRHFDRVVENFKTLEEACAFLNKKYAKHKRQRMYDDRNDPMVSIGYMIGFTVNSGWASGYEKHMIESNSINPRTGSVVLQQWV
jgi:hypothetical protein